MWNVGSGASLTATSTVAVGPGGISGVLLNGGASINDLGIADSITGAAGSANIPAHIANGMCQHRACPIFIQTAVRLPAVIFGVSEETP